VSLVGDGELAVTECVPELNGPIAGSRDDLPVVGGEGNGENVVGVAHESASSGTRGELPQAESLVPGGGEGICTIRRDDLDSVSAQKPNDLQFLIHSHLGKTYAVGDDVRVAVQRALWVTVGTLVAGQVPDDEGLVARTRQEHVWVFQRGREGGNPSAVTLKGTLENELFRHVEGSLGGAQSICDVGLRRGIQNLEF
jgi:hypothetical protein